MSRGAGAASGGRRGLQGTVVAAAVFLAMFFATWGSGLQRLSAFDVSKIFPVIAAVLVLYAALFLKNRVVFPRAFSAFVAFYFLHMAVTYGVFHPDEFVFGYLGARMRGDGFVAVREGAAIVAVRIALFLCFGYALGALLWDRRRVHAASAGYGAGLLAVLLLGGYVASDRGAGEVRRAGGFLDPNSLGFSGLTAAALGAIAFSLSRRDLRLRLLHGASILVGAAAILQSGSRASMLGFVSAGTLIVASLRNFSRKLILVLAAALAAASAFVVMPSTTYETLKNRANLDRLQADRGANRLDIWGNYLGELPRYAPTGVGFLHSMDVISGSYTAEFALTHNQYLEILVETGIVGFALFLYALARIWVSVYFCAERGMAELRPMLLAALVCLFVEFMFMNCFYSRDTWILLGVVAGVFYHRRAYA